MTSSIYAIGIMLGLASTVIDKPALHPNLAYCNQGLMDNLRPTESNQTSVNSGFIPQDCSRMTRGAGLNPVDVTAYSVHYSDCEDPWILCHHKDAPNTVENLVDLFGRVPVGTRQWVRHVIQLPDSSGHAYNSGGNIAIFGRVVSGLNVLVHESGHSLDLLGAYGDLRPLSSSQVWLDSYRQDSAVPDNYARSNQVENVAQNTVVALFDRVVPGGFGTIEPGFAKISHQYSTIQDQADENGFLLRPNGTCAHRLNNSALIRVTNSTTSTSRARRRYSLSESATEVERKSVPLSPRIKIIAPKSFDTRDLGCPLSHRH